MTSHDTLRPDNEIFLRGRLTGEPELRVLPSGDELVSFRLTVARPAHDRTGSRSTVDSIDCATLAPKVRRCVERAQLGDELELTGSLRRRFWRGAAGLASRYEVIVTSARSNSPVRRRRSDASPGRTPASV